MPRMTLKYASAKNGPLNRKNNAAIKSNFHSPFGTRDPFELSKERNKESVNDYKDETTLLTETASANFNSTGLRRLPDRSALLSKTTSRSVLRDG